MSEKPIDALSLTKGNLDIGDIIEPLTVIRLDVENQKKELDTAINGLEEFFARVPEVEYEEKDGEKILIEPLVPYCYNPNNQTDFNTHANVISRSLSSILELAKQMRQELYIKPDESKPQFAPTVPEPIEVKEPDKEEKKSTFDFMKNPFKKQKHDPNSPLSRMEKSIQTLEAIQREVWGEALAWHKVDVSDAALILKGIRGVNTKLGLEIESTSWIAIFGYKIVPNVMMAFEYGSKLRLRESEQHASRALTALQTQGEKERKDFTKPTN